MGERTLPDIATHREMLLQTPVLGATQATSRSKTMLNKDRHANSYVSHRIRNSALKMQGGPQLLSSPLNRNTSGGAYALG